MYSNNYLQLFITVVTNVPSWSNWVKGKWMILDQVLCLNEILRI